MSNIFLSEIYSNLFRTSAALVVLALLYFLLITIIKHRTDSSKNKNRLKLRAFYLICFIFIILLTKIWVQGFSHLFAVLGLVGAALVVTNKETIMNLTGWLIIIWRELFSEDDYIEIQHYKGYVRHLGFFYFTLSDMSSITDNAVSGKIIRIPNSMAITNPTINHSQNSYLLKTTLSLLIHPDSDIELAKQIILREMEKVLYDFCHTKPEYSTDYIQRKNHHLKDLAILKPSISMKLKFDKPAGVQLLAQYFCYAKDQEYIEMLMWEDLLIAFSKEHKAKLLFEGKV